MITITINITSVGVQRRNIFVPSRIQSSVCVCVSVLLSVCLYIWSSALFLAIKACGHNCMHHMWPQEMWSNTLSVSTICLYIYPLPGCQRAF